MQLGKYVFIVRPNGSVRHYRFSQWRRFLSGEIPFLKQFSTDVVGQQCTPFPLVVAFECHFSLDSPRCDAFYQWHVEVDVEGFYLASMRKLASGFQQSTSMLDERDLVIEYINGLLTSDLAIRTQVDVEVVTDRLSSGQSHAPILEQVELFGFESPAKNLSAMPVANLAPTQKRCA